MGRSTDLPGRVDSWLSLFHSVGSRREVGATYYWWLYTVFIYPRNSVLPAVGAYSKEGGYSAIIYWRHRSEQRFAGKWTLVSSYVLEGSTSWSFGRGGTDA